MDLPQRNIYVDFLQTQHLCCVVNSGQARRYLARRGCTFAPGRGGHLHVRRGERRAILPQHGGSKELGTGLWKKILKDLGLENEE